MNSSEVLMMNFKCVPAAFAFALFCLSLSAWTEGTGKSASTPSLACQPSAELYLGAALKESRDAGGEGDESGRKVRLDAGIKAALNADVPVGGIRADMILSCGLPYTDVTELGGADGGNSDGEGLVAFLDEKHLLRAGVSFYMSTPRLPYDAALYCGTLRFAGGLARLKKPCLAAPWNYGSISLLSRGLAAGLPGFTSSETPPACAVVLKPSGGADVLPAVELAVTQEGEAYASLSTEMPVPFSTSSLVYLAGNAGSFVYGGKELKSWFYKEPYYRERRYLSADAEAGFRLEKYLSLNLAAGFSENPHGSFEEAFFWRRGQAALSFRHLGLTASHFCAETPDMILPGGSRLNQRSRLSLNPSVRIPVKFPSGEGRLSLALLGMKDGKLKGGEDYDSFCHGFKAAWKFRRLSLSGQYTESFPERGEDGEESPHVRKLGLGLSWRGGSFRTSSSLSLKREGEKDTLSFSQKLYPARGAVSSVSLGIGSQLKDGEQEKLTMSLGAAFLFRAGHCNIRGKLLYSSTFCGEF